MNPRRLIPYIIILLVLGGAYLGLKWHQFRQEAQELRAKKIFQVAEKDVSTLTLTRRGEEIRLVKQDYVWQLTAPLKTRADQAAVDAMLVSLAGLQKERDLGPRQDLKTFGLEQPTLVLEFTAQGQPHRLAIGAQVPGARGYYARKDQDPQVVLIGAAAKDSLDRSLPALRDKTLLSFRPEEVRGVAFKSGKALVNLEKTGATWRWVGRPDFQVRPDRVEQLLRALHAARIKEFLDQPPKNLRPLGLAPRPRTEVTLLTGTGKETLFLGAPKDGSVYARKGPEGPVVLVDQTLEADLAKAASSLEDRRLWRGPVAEAQKLVWGPPGKQWTAQKEQDFWKISGPEGAPFRQPAARLELALWKLQNLEYGTVLPRVEPAPETFSLEVLDAGSKPLFRLEELGKKGDRLTVQARQGDQTLAALVPARSLDELKGDLARLTTPPQKDLLQK